ncbi:TIGR02530 family flagellar biosynthesis protein [Cytobacillus purgationiresistens]|uniref:Flagellar operon protein n=1 Tax=Cytobacillus purgationiresistens TaxID=863449 RepID=A0ABU0AG46_9BACI|nr:TIGR02530 family flagellar biosynthesis protein [Cytobacillus purgationiresistens]MDQ0270224.1 flagellar operon protein [Cytobacillus purgationiresistens]
MNDLTIQSLHSRPIVHTKLSPKFTGEKVALSGSKFAQHFQSALQPETSLTISKHAKDRMEKRGIEIDSERWEQITNKVKQAKNLGVNDSLVLLSDAALVVSAKNQTVITAMNRAEAATQIFTNINGTIIIDQ